MNSFIRARRAEAIRIVTEPGEHSPSLIALAIRFLKRWGVR